MQNAVFAATDGERGIIIVYIILINYSDIFKKI